MAGKDEDRMGDFSFRMTSLVWFKPWWKVFFRPFIGWEGFIRHPGLCPGFVLRTACSHPAGVGSDTRHRSLAIFSVGRLFPDTHHDFAYGGTWLLDFARNHHLGLANPVECCCSVCSRDAFECECIELASFRCETRRAAPCGRLTGTSPYATGRFACFPAEIRP